MGGEHQGKNSRVVPELDLAPVAQLPEPPELVVRVLHLGVAEEVNLRVGEGVVRVVQVRVEVARALGEDVAGRGADVAVLARDGGVYPLLLCPARLVYLGRVCQLGCLICENVVLGPLTSHRTSLLPHMSLE